MIIGLLGIAGSGKPTVSGIVLKEFGFTRVRFVYPLKNMLRMTLRDIAMLSEEAAQYVGGLIIWVISGTHPSWVHAWAMTPPLATFDCRQEIWRTCTRTLTAPVALVRGLWWRVA